MSTQIKKIFKNFPLILPWFLIAILYAPVFYELYRERWKLVDYGHAYWILPASLFIVWLKRKELAAVLAKPDDSLFWPGLFLTAVSLFLFTFGWKWIYMVVLALSFILLLFGMVSCLYGRAAVRLLSFPILYLLLLVPPPIGILDSITVPMRGLASVATEIILKIFHYPVSREGLLLSLGGHEIFLGAPCSGFRSLITMIALGLLYFYLNAPAQSGTKRSRSGIKSLIIIGAIIPLALLGNIIRVLAICLITFYFGSEAGQGFMHEFSGILVFVIMIFGLMSLERFIQ